MLSLDNITINRGSKKLLSGLGITAFPGSLIVVRGSNGIGKTTLLRTVAGIYQPAEGVVCWNEVAIHDEYDTYCSLIKYLGHSKMLKVDLSVRDNLSFWALMSSTVEMLPAAVRYYGLDAVLDMTCGSLSAGWQQRVALASVMASRAMLWILDEPTTNLDQDGIDLLFNAISIRCQQGGIVMIASHSEVPLEGIIELDLSDYHHQMVVDYA